MKKIEEKLFWFIEAINKASTIKSIMNLSHTMYVIADAKALCSILYSFVNLQVKSCWSPADWDFFTLSVIFLDCIESAQVRIIKIKYFCLLLSYFWNIKPKLWEKGKSVTPNTLKYFQQYRRKGCSKIKRSDFCFKIGSYLKFFKF